MQIFLFSDSFSFKNFIQLEEELVFYILFSSTLWSLKATYNSLAFLCLQQPPCVGGGVERVLRTVTGPSSPNWLHVEE